MPSVCVKKGRGVVLRQPVCSGCAGLACHLQNGKTPLDNAREQGHTACVEAFQAFHGSPNQVRLAPPLREFSRTRTIRDTKFEYVLHIALQAMDMGSLISSMQSLSQTHAALHTVQSRHRAVKASLAAALEKQATRKDHIKQERRFFQNSAAPPIYPKLPSYNFEH